MDTCTIAETRAGTQARPSWSRNTTGDDANVTHRARLTATVRWRDTPGVDLQGGVGVGVVTKPGLGLS